MYFVRRAYDLWFGFRVDELIVSCFCRAFAMGPYSMTLRMSEDRRTMEHEFRLKPMVNNQAQMNRVMAKVREMMKKKEIKQNHHPLPRP